MDRKTYVKDIERVRKQHLTARNVLMQAGKPDFKRESSAKWIDYGKDETGCIVAKVQHDDVKGCTLEMIQWFFEHAGAGISYGGVYGLRYN